MFGLKGKMLLYFVLVAALLAGVGIYFFLSISHLKSKVEMQFESKQQTNLLKGLTLDINKLNNQYLNDTLELSDHYIDSIIKNVKDNIHIIQEENRKLNFEHYHSLDSIPNMLYKLKIKNFELKELRNKGEQNFVLSLEEIIQDEFKDQLLSEKDSIIVTHQITSYIRENRTQVYGPPSPILELDTLTRQQTDTLQPINKLKSSVNLMKVYESIQMKRIKYINNIQEVEKEIYELNYRINSKIEKIINDFILQQYTSYKASSHDLKMETSRQSTILLFAIIGFTFFSIFLIYRFFKDINRNLDYQNTLQIKEQYATREAEEKQRFLHTMNHEIRTPLTSIIGYADLLEDDNKNVRAIKSSANYLYQMTNEILDIAKINLGVIDIKVAPIDITETLQDVKNTFEPGLENKGLDYVFDFPEGPIYINTDGQRVQQILYNLLHNAIKFTKKGFVHLKVKVYEKVDHYYFEFSVIDSGVGMSKQEQVQVFEDFHQAGTHKSKMKGTGLGLGIVKKLVHRLDGEIQVESIEGQGTTFKVAFDFPKATEKELKSVERKHLADESLKNLFSGKSILIVDDDALITNLYAKMIAPTNAKVVTFNNPVIALQELDNGSYDLLIIDYRMPEMSGYEFIMRMKEITTKLPKSIVSTANTLLDEEDKRKLNTFDKTIFKPTKKDEFLYEIASILGVQPPKIEGESLLLNEDDEMNFSALKNYVGDDIDDLIEILEVTIEENKVSLSKMEKAIQTSNSNEISFIIHQLSSRFAQIDRTLTMSTKELEAKLKTTQNGFPISEAKELFEFWEIGNEKIKTALNNLRKDNE